MRGFGIETFRPKFIRGVVFGVVLSIELFEVFQGLLCERRPD